MPVYEIVFKDFTMRPGFNTTLRLGKSHYENLEIGKIIRLRDYDNTKSEWAEVKSLAFHKFGELSPADVASHHCSRTYDDLEQAMKKCYYGTFNFDSYVTVIGFDVLEGYKHAKK